MHHNALENIHGLHILRCNTSFEAYPRQSYFEMYNNFLENDLMWTLHEMNYNFLDKYLITNII